MMVSRVLGLIQLEIPQTRYKVQDYPGPALTSLIKSPEVNNRAKPLPSILNRLTIQALWPYSRLLVTFECNTYIHGHPSNSAYPSAGGER